MCLVKTGFACRLIWLADDTIRLADSNFVNEILHELKSFLTPLVIDIT
jgi:hypothetical protein